MPDGRFQDSQNHRRQRQQRHSSAFRHSRTLRRPVLIPECHAVKPRVHRRRTRRHPGDRRRLRPRDPMTTVLTGDNGGNGDQSLFSLFAPVQNKMVDNPKLRAEITSTFDGKGTEQAPHPSLSPVGERVAVGRVRGMRAPLNAPPRPSFTLTLTNAQRMVGAQQESTCSAPKPPDSPFPSPRG